MSFKTFLFLSGLSVTTFCLWLIGQKTEPTARIETSMTELNGQKKPLLIETAATQEKLASIEKEITTLTRAITILQQIEFIDATVPPSAEQAAKSESSSIAEQEKKAQAYRAHLAAQYAPFCYRRGLSDAQIDRLEVILTDHWQSKADIEAIKEAQKLTEADPAVVKLQVKADETLSAAEKELLGEDGLKQLQEYERSLPARQFAASVAEHLYFTDSPLSAKQAEQLTELLARNNEPFRNGQPFDMEATDWPKVIEQMQPILSPPQQTGFHNVYNVHAVLPRLGESVREKANQLFATLSTEAAKSN
ncbi:MAG: hypothetical protein QM790_17935 [Nibricoccus sp.]